MLVSEILDGLARRCEEATGPDRELDEAIRDAVFDVRNSGPYYWLESPTGEIVGADTQPRHYTASLDAAMTLVPEGWLVQELAEQPWPDDETRPWTATLRPRKRGDIRYIISLNCASAALALCAAALRSSAALAREGEISNG